MSTSTIGSVWRRWDLHIHTNASDGKGSCQEILDEARNKKVRCIAVTDHHTVANVDEMKRLAEPMGITVISGVEFRTEYGKASVHMIGLFPDLYEGMNIDGAFLNENVLNHLGITRSKILHAGKESLQEDGLSEEEYFKRGIFCVQVDFRAAADVIHKYGGLVSVHAGSKNNSIDEEMKHEGRSKKNVSIEDSLGPVKEELFRDGYIDICDLTHPKEAEFYLKTFGKPSITTSDAHAVEEVGTNACWIKADLSFEGLKQILAEPERVCFDTPPLLERLRKNPDKFIRSIEVRRAAGATMPEVWFDNIRIDINPGLVAVIGNKGSGKSALTDIIALCSNSSNQNWAFLTSSKYRMPKPYNRSKQTEAVIGWYDKSHSSIKTLDMSSDLTQPERVKYIPQNFLETLCTTEDDQQFEGELKKIIFQYLAEDQRYGLNDLDSIISYLTKENTGACTDILTTIKELNADIIQKEAMMEPSYKAKLENELKYKQEQLANTQIAKPIEVPKPRIGDDPEAEKSKTEIEKLTGECQALELQTQELVKQKTVLSKNVQDLTSSKERLIRIKNQIVNISAELEPSFKEAGVNISDVISIEIHPEVLETKIAELQEEVRQIDNSLDPENQEGVYWKYNLAMKTLENAKKKLSEPELLYQKYLKDKKEWEKQLEDITGSEDKEGTIKYLQAKIDHIEHRLAGELTTCKRQRREHVEALVNKKAEVLHTYNLLFSPIVRFIGEYHEALKDYPIEFDASFAIREFGEKFFDYVSQQAAGSYYGKEAGALRIKENIDSVDYSNTTSIVNFAHQINEDLLFDMRDGNRIPRLVDAQLKKGHTKQELYDYIYGMEYVSPYFQLKMNGKPLASLSPGERGALLLLLYLFIDMDDKPLIIDQPEENLDNESVFNYLVHFVKAAKQKRQIIMVTHNPNLAVVCDADQIIQMRIDKAHGNIVSYKSGAIENPEINKIIVDILEGTYPAFHNRDCKYFDKKV